MDAPLDPQTPGNFEPAPQDPFTAAAPPVATPAELHTHPNSAFFGRFGMRAGWGIAIFLIVFVFLAVVGGLAAVGASGHLKDVLAAHAYAQTHPGQPKPKLHLDFTALVPLVEDGIIFLSLFGLCWFFSKGERRPLRSYGIGSYRISDIVPGAIWGLLVLSALVGVLRAGHWLVFDGQNVHGTAIVTYGLGWLAAFLCVGLAEEYEFRGYVQYTLMRGVWGLAEKISATNTRAVAFWISACIWSLVFALAHTGNGGENFFGLVQVFIAGITFAYALWRTGSLWWGIGFHMTWDWAQSFLFGVADSGNISVGRLFVTHPQGRPLLSGGADGPEGSVFATIALLITIAIIHFTARPGMQPALEPEPKPQPHHDLPQPAI
jgi:hypothetical protein